MIEVTQEFIADALYSRFNEVRGFWASAIHEELIDEYIECVSSIGGTFNSASEVIDNWLINGEHGTYEEAWNCWIYDDEEWKGDDIDQILEVESYLDMHGYMFDRSLQEYCSF